MNNPEGQLRIIFFLHFQIDPFETLFSYKYFDMKLDLKARRDSHFRVHLHQHPIHIPLIPDALILFFFFSLSLWMSNE